jgi:hypothetical protein
MTRAEILDAAKECVLKDRNATHGNPEDNFKTIAGFWTDYLRDRYKPALLTPVTLVDVAAMMTLVKVSRLISSPKHADHWVDIAGYAACGGEIATLHHHPDVKS